MGESVSLPIAFAAAVLLGLIRIGVAMASFGEEPRKVLFSCSGAVGKARVVAVRVLVGASHCSRLARQVRDGC
jgi:hypothetical protein